MRRRVAAFLFVLAASAVSLGQADPEAARRELDAGARLYRTGKFAEAEQRFRRALELDPEGKDTRLFIARAAHQQYRPGVTTPENLAAGERAVAAYQEVLEKDHANEDAYKAVILLLGQMKQEEKVRETLLWRANDFSRPNAKRAEAFVILASKHWNCSYDLTERKENKTTAEAKDKEAKDKVVVSYKMPADPGDLIRARQCVTDGLQFVEQALALDPQNRNAWAYKSNLLREAAKLAEMEGDAAQKEEYHRQYEQAAETHKRMSDDGAKGAPPAAPGATPPPPPAPTPEPQGGRRPFITGGVLNGKAVSKPQPAYPAEAKAAGAQGTVSVRVVVDEEGRVVEAEAVSGHALLQAAAVAAARQARFTPTLLKGQPVKVTGVVTYNFVLR